MISEVFVAVQVYSVDPSCLYPASLSPVQVGTFFDTGLSHRAPTTIVFVVVHIVLDNRKSVIGMHAAQYTVFSLWLPPPCQQYTRRLFSCGLALARRLSTHPPVSSTFSTPPDKLASRTG